MISESKLSAQAHTAAHATAFPYHVTFALISTSSQIQQPLCLSFPTFFYLLYATHHERLKRKQDAHLAAKEELVPQMP